VNLEGSEHCVRHFNRRNTQQNNLKKIKIKTSFADANKSVMRVPKVGCIQKTEEDPLYLFFLKANRNQVYYSH
jgi:hypothetical protein